MLRQAPRDTLLSSFNMWLCYCYYLLRHPTQGLLYGQTAVRLLTAYSAGAPSSLTAAYAILGDCATILPTLALAHRYYSQLVRLAQATRDTLGIALSWTNLAALSLKQQHLAQAAQQLDSARQYLKPRS